MLRVIFGHIIEKLTLPSRIPQTVEELNLAVKQALSITEDFSLQYLDPDFEDFFTLHSTAQIKHKATIKVVTMEPVVLNLYPVPHNESYTESVTSELDPLILPPQVPLHRTRLTPVVLHLQAQSSCHQAAAQRGSHGQLNSSFHDSLLKRKLFLKEPSKLTEKTAHC